MKKFFIIFFLFFPAFAFAETITLQSGKQIDGDIVEKTDDYIKIQTDAADMKVKIKLLSEESRVYVESMESFLDQSTGAHADRIKRIPPENISLNDLPEVHQESGDENGSPGMGSPVNAKQSLVFNYGTFQENIYDVLIDLGYHSSTAYSISSILGLVGMQEPILRDPDDDVAIVADTQRNLGFFVDYIGPFGGIDPFMLNVMYQMIGVQYEEELKEIQKSATADDYNSLLRCAFISYVSYVLYKAKGADIHGIQTNGINEDVFFQDGLKGVKKFFGIKTPGFLKDGHLLNMVKLNSGQYILIDFTNRYMSEPFWLETDTEIMNGNYVFTGRKEVVDQFKIVPSRYFQAALFSNLSVILTRLGRHDRADFFIDQALAIAPDYILALCNKGDFRLAQNDYDGAISVGEQCIQAAPEESCGYFLAGCAYYYKGDDDRAFVALSKARELDPGDANVSRYLGHVYFAVGNHAAARRELERALDLYKQFYKGADSEIAEIEKFMKEKKLKRWF